MNTINTPVGIVTSRTDYDPAGTSLAERYRQALGSSALPATEDPEESEETEAPGETEDPPRTKLDECPEEVETGDEEEGEGEKEIPCYMRVLTRQWGRQMLLETLMYGEEEESGVPTMSIDI